MSIIIVGIDLAKNVVAVHGVDDNGKAALVKPKVSREHLLPLTGAAPIFFGAASSDRRERGRPPC